MQTNPQKLSFYCGGKNSKQTHFFQPLISTSLALALGFNVALCATPTISINEGSKDVSSSLANFTWQNLQNAGNVYQPTTGQTPITELTLKFTTGNSSASGSAQGDKYTITTNNTEGQKSSLTLKTTDSALQMGGGTGVLIVDFSGRDAQEKSATLDLQGKKAGNLFTASGVEETTLYSYVGSLTIQGGDDTTKATFVANFAGGMLGNINTSGESTNTFTFGDGAKLQGNLSFNGGINKLTFKNQSTLEGNTTLSGGTNTLDFGTKDGNATTILGNIIASQSSTNTINLTGSATISGSIKDNSDQGSTTINAKNNTTISGEVTNVTFNLGDASIGDASIGHASIGGNFTNSILDFKGSGFNSLTLRGENNTLKELKITGTSGGIIFDNPNQAQSLTVATQESTLTINTDKTLNFTFNDNTNVTLQNAIHNNGSSTIQLGSSSGNAQGSITGVIKGVNLDLRGNSNILTLLGSGENTAKEIRTNNGSGTIVFGANGVQSLKIGDGAITVSANKTLDFTFKDNNQGTLKNALTATGASSTIKVGTQIGNAQGTITGNATDIHLAFVGSGNTLTLQGTLNKIQNLSPTGSGTLILSGTNAKTHFQTTLTNPTLTLKFGAQNNQAILEGSSDNLLGSIDTTAQGGVIIFGASGTQSLQVGGSNSTISAESSKSLDFLFQDNVKAMLKNSIDATDGKGSSKVTLGSTNGNANGSITGNIQNTSIVFQGSQNTLTLLGSGENSANEIQTSSGSGTIIFGASGAIPQSLKVGNTQGAQPIPINIAETKSLDFIFNDGVNGILENGINATNGSSTIQVGSKNGNSQGAILGEITKVKIAFQGANNTLDLGGATNTATQIDTTNGSGTIIFGAGDQKTQTLSVQTKSITITDTKSLNFTFKDGVTATLENGIDATQGTSTILVDSRSGSPTQGIITGDVTKVDITFAGIHNTLTLQGSTNTIKSISQGEGTLNLTATNGSTHFLSPINHPNLTLAFGQNSTTQNLAILTTSDNLIKDIQTQQGSGTIAFQEGTTSLTVGSVGKQISAGANKSLDFLFKDNVNATLNNGIDATAPTKGSSKVTLGSTSGNANGSISGNIQNTSIAFKGSQNTLTLLANGENSAKEIQTSSGSGTIIFGASGTQSLQVGEANSAISAESGKSLDFLFQNGVNATLNNGIDATAPTKGSSTLTLGSASGNAQATITGKITDVTLAFKGDDSTLTLQGSGENTAKNLELLENTGGTITFDSQSQTQSFQIKSTEAITLNNNTSMDFVFADLTKTTLQNQVNVTGRNASSLIQVGTKTGNAQGTITGDVKGVELAFFGNQNTLTLQGNENTIKNVDTQNTTQSTLILSGSNNASTTFTSTLNTPTLTLKFGTQNNQAILKGSNDNLLGSIDTTAQGGMIVFGASEAQSLQVGVRDSNLSATTGKSLDFLFQDNVKATLNNGIDATASTKGSSKVTLGSASGNANGSITGNITNIAVAFKGENSTLTLLGAQNTIASGAIGIEKNGTIAFGANEAQNLQVGETNSAISAGANKSLDFLFQDNVNATLNNGIDATGGKGSSTLTLGSANGNAKGSISGNIKNTSIAFKGSQNTLTLLGSGENTAKEILTNEGSGTIIFGASETQSLQVGGANSAISAESGKSLDFLFQDGVNATLKNGIDATAPTKGSSTLTLGSTSGNAQATITGDVKEIALNLLGTGNSLTLQGTQNSIASLSQTGSAEITLSSAKASLTFSNNAQNANTTIHFDSSDQTLTLQGQHNLLKTVVGSGTISLDSATSTTFASTLGEASLPLNILFASSKETPTHLTLQGQNNALNTLSGEGAILFDKGADGSHQIHTLEGRFDVRLSGTNSSDRLPSPTGTKLRTLEIANLQGENTHARATQSSTFTLFGTTNGTLDPSSQALSAYNADGTMATTGGSDRLIVKNGSGNHTLGLGLDGLGSHTGGDKYLVLAQVQNIDTNTTTFNNLLSDDQTAKIELDLGFDHGEATLQRKTQDNQTYYYTNLDQSVKKTMQVNSYLIAPTAAALSVNYNLMSTNLNSLNKRMGDLREYPHSQGVWTRLFAGEMNADFGLELKPFYLTLQAGYDYGFSLQNATNYLGFALSYLYANTKESTKEFSYNNQTFVNGLQSALSSGAEIALYNTYIADWGLYSDSIIKLSYLQSKIKLLHQDKDHQAQNLAFALSEEVGYRFTLGSQDEWLIDPQVELSYAYLNQANFTQSLKNVPLAFLKSSQDAIHLIRTRLGVNWGYDFKVFTADKPISAKLYLGTSYAFDSLLGGDVHYLTNNDTRATFDAMQSNGRFVLNLGTQLSIKENAKIYFDFEKSFGNKMQKTYQLSLGVRYAFGQSYSRPTPPQESTPTIQKPTPNTQESTPTILESTDSLP